MATLCVKGRRRMGSDRTGAGWRRSKGWKFRCFWNGWWRPDVEEPQNTLILKASTFRAFPLKQRFGVGNSLCGGGSPELWGCSAASLASTHSVPVAPSLPPTPMVKTKNISTHGLGTELPLTENHSPKIRQTETLPTSQEAERSQRHLRNGSRRGSSSTSRGW